MNARRKYHPLPASYKGFTHAKPMSRQFTGLEYDLGPDPSTPDRHRTLVTAYWILGREVEAVVGSEQEEVVVGQNEETGEDIVETEFVDVVGPVFEPHPVGRELDPNESANIEIRYRLPDAFWTEPGGVVLPRYEYAAIARRANVGLPVPADWNIPEGFVGEP